MKVVHARRAPAGSAASLAAMNGGLILGYCRALIPPNSAPKYKDVPFPSRCLILVLLVMRRHSGPPGGGKKYETDANCNWAMLLCRDVLHYGGRLYGTCS